MKRLPAAVMTVILVAGCAGAPLASHTALPAATGTAPTATGVRSPTPAPVLFRAEVTVPVPGGPGAVVVSDMNGDGNLDLVSANDDDGTVSLLIGSGQGTFVRRPDVLGGPGAVSIAVADLNGDQRVDIILAHAA